MKIVSFLLSLFFIMKLNSFETPALPPIKPRTFHEQLVSLQDHINRDNASAFKKYVIQLHWRAEWYGSSRDRAVANRLLSIVTPSRYSYS